MKKSIGYIIFMLIGITSLVFAQQKERKRNVLPKSTTYFSGGEIGEGVLSKKIFDSLITAPLIVKDSLGKEFPVYSYLFTYVERKIYEDSTGRPFIHPDYISSNSDKGTLPSQFENYILEHSKGGDTVYISNVVFYLEDSDTVKTSAYANPIKIILKN